MTSGRVPNNMAEKIMAQLLLYCPVKLKIAIVIVRFSRA